MTTNERPTTLHTRVARLICCPSGTCCSPDACYAEDRSRSQLVDIHAAAATVIRNLPALMRDAQEAQRERDSP